MTLLIITNQAIWGFSHRLAPIQKKYLQFKKSETQYEIIHIIHVSCHKQLSFENMLITNKMLLTKASFSAF